MRKRSNVAGIVAAAAAGFVMSGHAQAQETGAGATTTAKPMSGNLVSITQAMLDGAGSDPSRRESAATPARH